MSGTKTIKHTNFKKPRVKTIDGPLYSSKGAEVGEKWTDYFSDKEIKEIRLEQKKR
tara:strand:+ start:97 stop:264 length:168 start_codon:yes stop_codon:yes gene_type:complete